MYLIFLYSCSAILKCISRLVNRPYVGDQFVPLYIQQLCDNNVYKYTLREGLLFLYYR